MNRILLLLIVFTASCQFAKDEEHRKLDNGVPFQLHQFGEGESPKKNSYLKLLLTVEDTLGDTLHYVPNYPYFIKIEETLIDSCLQKFNLGDSISLIIDRKKVNEKFKFYQLLQSDQGKVMLNLRILKIFSNKTEMEEAKYKLLSKREVEEQAALKKYLNKIDKKWDTLDGVYRLIAYQSADSSLPKIQYGSQISLHYRGRFLNGYVFDDTYKKKVSPTFVYGQDYQLIEGMHNGLIGLKESDSMKIIVPSRRGFGELGSLAGIVPPYTAVIFDVKIKKVSN